MHDLKRQIKEHNARIFDRIGWKGPIVSRKMNNVIHFKKLGPACIQVFPHSDASRKIVRNTIEVHADGTLLVWAVNPTNNFGFTLYERAGVASIRDILRAFADLRPANVRRAFKVHMAPALRRSPRR